MNTSFFQLQVDKHNYAWLTFDTDGAKVNTLGFTVMHELREHIRTLATQHPHALIIQSGKEHQFIAGANIGELQNINSVENATEKAKLGQSIFNELAALPFPTLAYIDGPCMGGGTELALACTYRLASDHKSTKIALPEVQLGFVPGWGGTQRLPRLIGIPAALDLLCSGKTVNSKKALRLGLVDGCISDVFAADHIKTFLGKPKHARRKRSLLNRFLESKLGRSLVFKKAREAVMKNTHGHYPAPLQVIDVVARTCDDSLESGLLHEANTFGSLSQTTISKNLVHIFLESEELKKKARSLDCGNLAAPSHTGVVGAGIMGGGIAWLFAGAGYSVRIKDLNWDAIRLALHTASGIFTRRVKRKKMRQHDALCAMHRMSGCIDGSGLHQADIIVEAVVENLDVKKKVLADLDTQTAHTTTLCSNTSSLRMADMAEALENTGRFIGMHFFNPVHRMPLVEVIAGPDSNHHHVARVAAFCAKLGKIPIIVADCPGFLVNRILLPYINEAAWLYMDGASIADVDRTLTQFGMPMGPFTLADEVGLDVGYHVAHNLEQGYGERMAVAPILHKLAIEEKLLGKKGNKGFYLHNKKTTPVVNSALTKNTPQNTDHHADTTTIRNRCLGIMVNEAARCLDEGIVASPAELDMAMIYGTGFPPFHGGLCAWADTIGLKTLITTLTELATTLPRFTPCDALIHYADNGGFYNKQ